MTLPETISSQQRLNKYLAFHLGISRRKADQLIEDGFVAVNDVTAELGERISVGDTVSVRGTPVVERSGFTYIVVHKPAGYVCSRKAQGDLPTIYTLLPTQFHHLKTVGRLDAESSGIILLTDDGDFAFEMTHPKFIKHKIYHATLDRELEPLHQQMIHDAGIQLEDGESRLILQRASDVTRYDWIITMTEGRNRQIRRTFAALGYDVTTLHRTDFGPYHLGNLAVGGFELSKKI